MKNKKIVAIGVAAALAVVAAGWSYAQEAQPQETPAQANERLERIEAALDAIRDDVGQLRAEQDLKKEAAANRSKAQVRMRRDAEELSAEQLREIEELYQVANREWGSPQARQNLQEIVRRYPRSNRAGCALLYLAQMEQGAAQVELLEKAIADHSDSWYGDGVQVGAYARFLLGMAHHSGGRAEQAQALFAELAEDYPAAVDHKGTLLSEFIPSGDEREE